MWRKKKGAAGKERSTLLSQPGGKFPDRGKNKRAKLCGGKNSKGEETYIDKSASPGRLRGCNSGDKGGREGHASGVR